MQFYCCEFNLRKLSDDSLNVYTGFSSILCLDSTSAPLEKATVSLCAERCVCKQV